MLKRMTNEMVALAWVCGLPSVHLHMWTEDGTLYSYETPIGYALEKEGELHIILTTRNYSATTNKHLRAARSAALKFRGAQIAHVVDVGQAKNLLLNAS